MKKKELLELQKKFEEYFSECEDEIYLFKFTSNKESITLMCNMDEEDDYEEVFRLEMPNVGNFEQLFKELISAMYEKYINEANSFVKNWKNYSARKVRSLLLWTNRNNTEKIAEINKDLIERYIAIENAKCTVRHFKIFISMFYNIKNEYCIKEAM